MTASLTEYLLAYILNYGASFLGLVLLVGAIGVPIPTTLLVVAGGAFVRQGLLDLPTVAVIALVAARDRRLALLWHRQLRRRPGSSAAMAPPPPGRAPATAS